MQLFDFKVRYIPGIKNTTTNGLLRRARHPFNDINNALKKDINKWVLA
jgi:hypothetical protein